MSGFNRTITNIGSKVTSPAMNKALSTTLRTSTPRISSSAASTIGPSVKKSVHKGSAAGLNRSTSLHLNKNNSGYFNPNNQLARYSKAKMNYPNVNSNT